MIDPSVREDGEPEPSVELEIERRADAVEAATDGSDERSSLPRGERVRELLLERAEASRAAQAEPADASLGDLDDIGKSDAEATRDLELPPPGVRAPSAPELASSRGRLSPNLVALFSTLLGVATVSSLVLLGMSVDLKSGVGTPAASATQRSEEKPAPVAEVPKAVPKRKREKQPGPWRIESARGDAHSRIVEGKVGSDAFLKALEKAGLETREGYRILTSMKGVRDFDHCKASDKFSALVDRSSSKVKAFEYAAGPDEVYQARENADGFLKGAKLDLKVEHHQISGVLVYDGKSFDASAERAGFDSGLGKVVAKALDGHMSLDEIEPGSELRVLAQEVTVLGDFARYAGVEALEIRGPGAEKPFRLYYVDIPNERGYYDAEGHAPFEGGWRKPIEDAPMTSPYNLKRMHPILKKIMPHLGIDFGAPMGTPVSAAAPGTVAFAGYVGPTGNLVRLEHANGIETGYAHLSRFADGLKVGDKVKRMQVIGYVGSTGRSTGPHLHFSARRNGDFFDPATLNLDAMRTLSPAARTAFAEAKSQYDARLEAIALPEPLRAAAAPLRALAQAPARSAASASASGSVPAAPSAAPANAPSEDPSQSEDDDEGTTPAAGSPQAKPAGSSGSSVYLSDKELLKLQGAADEGEVPE